MKKLLLTATALLIGTAALWARPALKQAITLSQPDGTTVTLRMHGDEYQHHTSTSDGYSVVKDERGFFVYAKKEGGRLLPTTIVAHDEQLRTATEREYLKTTTKHLAPDMSEQARKRMNRVKAGRSATLAAHRAQRYDYSKFKGLVILVEYNDCQFKYSDYQAIMNDMINQENYTGTDKTNVPANAINRQNQITEDITCTGSMRDYFRDNSNGIFNPTFDVVGPVTVNRSQYYPNGHDNAEQLMIDACTAADSQVNFANYDTDGDGQVDMIYFIFAGLPSYIQGNDERLLWPHQYDLSYYRNVRKDGVRLGRYACSTELYGYEHNNWSILEGIGTMCHEFSHVLGLPDFYDADYDGSGGQSNDPGLWSVMANGADFNRGRTPCAYSLFERYALGFATPQVISQPGQCEMSDIFTSNAGYRLNTPVNNEYFMLENRQPVKWDAKLPGHGMLIFRVDSTNSYVWNYNSVNNTPSHNYYELLRAGGAHTYQGNYYDTTSDPFPGTNRVTVVNNVTEPANLKTWSGKLSLLGLRNIKESNGTITFEAYDVNVLTQLIMASSATVGVGTTLPLQVTYVPETATTTLTWTSDNEAVATVSNSGVVKGVAEGTATITVTAANGVSATCLVTVKDMLLAADIAAFRALNDNTEALLQLTNAQVLYVNGQDIYLRDASGTIVLSQTGISVSRNDVLNGSLYGSKVTKNRMPQLVGVSGIINENSVITTAGASATAVNLHVSGLTENRYADMVMVECVQLERDGGIWAVFGDRRVRLWNTFSITSPKITVPTDVTKRYNITAIYGTNVKDGEVIDELYLLKSPTAADYTALTGITLPESLQMEAGRTLQLSPVLTPANANTWLTYTSSDSSVATVDGTGKLTTIANGTATISVTDAETGLQAQCQVVVGNRLTVDNIAAFKALAPNTEAELTLTNAQVLYIHNNNMYVRDETGALILRGTGIAAKRHQWLNGHIFGAKKVDGRMPVLEGVADITTPEDVTMTNGSEAQPRMVTPELLSDDYLCDYVTVKAATLERTDRGIWMVTDNMQARLYNTFGVSGIKTPTVLADKYFNVTAIYGTNQLSGEVISELKLLATPEETGKPDDIVTVSKDATADAYYDLNGRRLSDRPAKGLYIVRRNGQYTKVMK